LIALPDELAISADDGLCHGRCFARHIAVCPVRPVVRKPTYPCQLRIFGAQSATTGDEAVDELKLAKGKPATAVIKASDVMVGVD
jgi:hypothetical protein